MTAETLPFATRLWFAFVCLFRILTDGAFARRLHEAAYLPALPPAEPEPPLLAPEVDLEVKSGEGALLLLELFQREGRLVDFLMQDIGTFSDSDIGAAARVVHDGCRHALQGHLEIQPIRGEEEGSALTLNSGFDPDALKLTGNVRGEPPYRGTLRHRGWRAASVDLPKRVGDHDVRVLAPAEVEL